jgi:CheY-like chemotaxis protein
MGQLEGVKVLVVEDDASSAKLFEVVFEAEGCETRITTSAEHALAALAEWTPDVIVLDLVLPLMSGLVFAQKVHALAAHIPIMAVSAFNGEEVKRAALAAGCVTYLRKPIDPISLPQLVSTHLGDRR